MVNVGKYTIHGSYGSVKVANKNSKCDTFESARLDFCVNINTRGAIL